MGQQNRVKRWRDAKRQHGLKAVTIWLTTEEELRLKDLALQWHVSPSAVVQQALAQFKGDTPPPEYISSPTDTLLIRSLIREELAMMQVTQTPVTVGATVTPPETQARLQPDNTGKTDVTETVTETVTEGVAVTNPSHARTYGEIPAKVLTILAQRQRATAAELASALGDSTKAGTKTVWQALQRLLKRGAVIREGQHYQLPE
jgi:hypothetical protein